MSTENHIAGSIYNAAVGVGSAIIKKLIDSFVFFSRLPPLVGHRWYLALLTICYQPHDRSTAVPKLSWVLCCTMLVRLITNF